MKTYRIVLTGILFLSLALVWYAAGRPGAGLGGLLAARRRRGRCFERPGLRASGLAPPVQVHWQVPAPEAVLVLSAFARRTSPVVATHWVWFLRSVWWALAVRQKSCWSERQVL